VIGRKSPLWRTGDCYLELNDYTYAHAHMHHRSQLVDYLYCDHSTTVLSLCHQLYEESHWSEIDERLFPPILSNDLDLYNLVSKRHPVIAKNIFQFVIFILKSSRAGRRCDGTNFTDYTKGVVYRRLSLRSLHFVQQGSKAIALVCEALSVGLEETCFMLEF